MKRYHIMKYASSFYRLTQMYFSDWLKPYDIGAGQWFFLDRIHKKPGITMAELADIGAFECSTVTRAIRKLSDDGMITSEPDENDKRARKLFITEKGEKLIEPMKQMRLEWFEIVTEGFSEEEKAQVGDLLGRLSENARNCVSKQRRWSDPDDDNSEEAQK